MAGHARVGRTYAGRVLQLITGSTGLDDWEWGVTLLADDPVVLKEIVYEMRFDRCRRATPSSVRSSPAWCSSPPTRCARRPVPGPVVTVDHVRLFVSFPEELVDRPMIYEIVKRFDVVPNIRRANVEAHSGWMILELDGSPEQRDAADRVPRRPGLHRQPDGRRRPRGMTSRARVDRRVERPAPRDSARRASIVDGVERELPGWVSVRSRASSTRGAARRRRALGARSAPPRAPARPRRLGS